MDRSVCFSLVHNLLPMVLLLVGIACAFWCPGKFGSRSLMTFYAVRFLLIVVAFDVGGLGSVDLDGWWQHALWMTDEGLFPGKDFATPYHLGFNFLLFVVAKAWHSPYAICILFTLAEVIGVSLMFHALKGFFPVEKLKMAIILFASSPVGYASALSTQDEPLMFLGVTAVLYAIISGWKKAAVLAMFATIAISKIFALFFVFPVVMLRRWKGIAWLILAVLVYWLTAYTVGVNPFDIRFGREVGLETILADDIMGSVTYGNVWKLLGIRPCVCIKCFAAAMIGVACALFSGGPRLSSMLRSDRVKVVLGMMTLMMYAFVAFYPMTFFMYLIPFLPFMYLAIVVNEKRWMLVFTLAAFTAWQFMLRYGIAESSFAGRHKSVFLTVYFGLFAWLVWRDLLLYGYVIRDSFDTDKW